ncbi:MAG: transposase [Myxococcales bacterium]|nr:transposase [Myxococcales bacterium]
MKTYREYQPRQSFLLPPRMMTALLLYDYCVGVPSSRKIGTRTHEDIAFRVLAGNTHPDHTCIRCSSCVSAWGF